MKSNILRIVSCALALMLAGAAKNYAQTPAKDFHIGVDWQMNVPFSTGYADKASGWGMNIEATYDVTPRWTVGAFLNFHTNHKYVGRQTLPISPTEALTTDQQRSAYQLPFGVTAAFNLSKSRTVRPYIGLKVGAAYSRYTTYFGTGGLYDNPWGFYTSPEIGLKIFPFKICRIGFHVAGYYSYMTNKPVTLSGEIEGQNNAGFRVGVIF